MAYYKNLLANERGIPLDAAIVIGGPPCITYAAVQPVPYGVDEVALAGGLARGPLEMVRWKTVDLEVPAHADIVIEGRISSDYLEPDGPFGEAHGYLCLRRRVARHALAQSSAQSDLLRADQKDRREPPSISCLKITFTSGDGVVHKVRYSFAKGSQFQIPLR